MTSSDDTTRRSIELFDRLSKMDKSEREAFLSLLEAKQAHQLLVTENIGLELAAYAAPNKANVALWVVHTDTILEPSKQALGLKAYELLKETVVGHAADFRDELTALVDDVRESVSGRVASARNKLAGRLVTK